MVPSANLAAASTGSSRSGSIMSIAAPSQAERRPIENPQWERFFTVSFETAVALFDRIGSTDPRRGIDMARALSSALASELSPARAPAGPDPQVAWHSLPAEEVGGDFHDLLTGPAGEVYIVIGDVSGSGPLAALFMAMASCLFRVLAADALPPGRMLEVANRVLQPHLSRRCVLVTAQVACYQPGARTLALASAGHMWPYIMKSDGFAEVPLSGMPLGACAGSSYVEHHEIVNPGQRMLLYTDGYVECTDPAGEMFGFERLTRALGAASTGSAADLVRSLAESFGRFVKEGRRRDDVSLVAVAWS